METTWAHRIAESAKYLSHAEVDLLVSLAHQLPEHAVCLNLGAGAGTSIIALLETRPDLVCYSVDTNPEMGFGWLREAGVLDRVIELQGDSQTMIWDKGEIDWLCIDASHDVASVTADITNWLLYACGYVMFHDYGDYWGTDMGAEVREAVDVWAKGRLPIALVDSLIVFDVRMYG